MEVLKKAAALLLALLAAAAFLLPPAAARADRYRVLDAALSMLEEGNPFLLRYNAENHADVRSLFLLGCPYFWGGRRVNRILQAASPDQDSDYYHTDKQYLYGLDCVGLTRWAWKQAGYAEHDSISNLLDTSKYKEYVNYRAQKNTGAERARFLQPGDLAALQHADGGFHIIMYIGTLVDFGYTRKNLPEELVPYLTWPLVIHCTGSSDYYKRYSAWLEENGDTGTLPPFGGVIVSILDVPAGDAPSFTPEIPELPELKRPCFDLEGYHLEILDLSTEKRQRWIRWRQRPEE